MPVPARSELGRTAAIAALVAERGAVTGIAVAVVVALVVTRAARLRSAAVTAAAHTGAARATRLLIEVVVAGVPEARFRCAAVVRTARFCTRRRFYRPGHRIGPSDRA